MEYVPELTGLRALAVFLAFASHAIPGMSEAAWTQPVTSADTL